MVTSSGFTLDFAVLSFTCHATDPAFDLLSWPVSKRTWIHFGNLFLLQYLNWPLTNTHLWHSYVLPTHLFAACMFLPRSGALSQETPPGIDGVSLPI